MTCGRYSVIATVQLVEFVCLLVRPPRAAYQSFALPPLPGSPPSPQDVGLDQSRGWFCSVRGRRTSGTPKSHPVNYQVCVLCSPHTGCWYVLPIVHTLYACFCCLVDHLKVLGSSIAFEGCLFLPLTAQHAPVTTSNCPLPYLYVSRRGFSQPCVLHNSLPTYPCSQRTLSC